MKRTGGGYADRLFRPTCPHSAGYSDKMILSKGSTTETLANEDIRQLVAQACAALPVDSKRVLVIIPDGTRTAPIALFFRLLYEELGRRVVRLDYLIALGTHPPMSEAAIDQMVGVPAIERAESY